MERGLFDDTQDTNGAAIEPRKPELSEPSPIDESGDDWIGDFEQLEDLIGSEAAWKVAGVFAGSAIYIPKSIFIKKNYFDIRRKFKAGSTYRELAMDFGYTETHIRNIIHRKKENT